MRLAVVAFVVAMLGFTTPSHALFVSPPKDPILLINKIFPELTEIVDKQGTPAYWTIKKGDNILGFAFETNDIAKIPAYSGEPVNMLVAIDPQGSYISARVLEHHEPIILAGIPESKLDDFSTQYTGLSVAQKIKVGGNATQGTVNIDGLSGATVTVRVMNVAITRAAQEIAKSHGIIEESVFNAIPMATVKPDVYSSTDWQTLVGDGSIRRLLLKRGAIDKAFKGTEAEDVDKATPEQKEDMFADIYYAQANLPNVGKNLLGEAEYQWLTETLQPGEHAIIVMGDGYSFKGSGYVRGAIFDRVQVVQNDINIAFRDLDHYRITDLQIDGAPTFKEMSLFIIREHEGFNPGVDWQFELLIRRQTGPLDSIFTTFKGEYSVLERYVERPIVEPELTLTQQVWQEKQAEVIILIIAMSILVFMLFFQDVFVRHPSFMHNFRHIFLIFTVVFIGWSWGGQLSVVNVFTFLQAFMDDFSWDLFLLDPVIFVLWIAVAVTIIIWGRAVYCGWLCPFGALQELINVFARYINIKQFEPPFAIHERLWAIKYLILLGLFGLSLDSLAMAEQFAEVEPFKTTFLLKFDRSWPFVTYVAVLLFINIFNRKFFCRYLCPLGAALSVPHGARLFSWLKRRPECGTPCKTCAKECEIQAIEPDGTINMRECHYCLDCQMTYFNDEKCPPLKKMARKKQQYKKQAIPVDVVN
ncbi:MAG: transcriptional regulator NosR [Cognaticolwellia aestuarii]